MKLRNALLGCLAVAMLLPLLVGCIGKGGDGETDTTIPVSDMPETNAPETEPSETDPPKTDAPETDWRDEYSAMQIINDATFADGFYIRDQATTENIGVWRTTDSTAEPVWQLAQWGTFLSYADQSAFQCLLRNDINPDPLTIENSVNRVTYDPEAQSLTLAMHSYDYYGEAGHTDTSNWPHLLIEQGIIDREALLALPEEERIHYTLAADKIILSMDLRMTTFSRPPLHPGTMACQFLSYYYIASTEDHGFTWFGVGLFDDRGYDMYGEPYFEMDKGSGKYMYGIPQYKTYRECRPNGRFVFYDDDFKPIARPDTWMHLELDLKPWLLLLAEQAMGPDGVGTYPDTTDLSQLFISGLNLGYELHGPYDVSFEIKNYAITTYVKK